MKHLFERIVELMGRKHDCPLFKNFLDEIGEEPLVYPPPDQPSYFFVKSAFFISSVGCGWFTCAVLFAGKTSSFPAFPANILATDCREDVLRKLVEPAVKSEQDRLNHTDYFFIQPSIVFGILFDPDSNRIKGARIYHREAYERRHLTAWEFPKEPPVI